MSPNAAQPVAGEQSSGLQSTSIVTFLTAIKESTARVERRLHVIEQTQAKLTDSIRELQSMVKSQEKETFCIKGSTYEVSVYGLSIRNFIHCSYLLAAFEGRNG